MTYKEDKGCFNCMNNEKNNSEYPCNVCNVYYYDKWESGEKPREGHVDLWD